MSRSYHKHVWWVYRAWKKWGKFFANKRIRKLSLDELINGMHYKRFFEQYDICDYRCPIDKDDEDYEKYKRK